MTVELNETASDAGDTWSIRRWSLIAFAAALALTGLAYLIYYAWVFHPKPSDAAVPTLLFTGLGTLVVLVAPWRDLGLIPTEIAGVKFERIVKAQKKEQIDALVSLQDELNALKAKHEWLLGTVVASNPELMRKHEELQISERFNITASAATFSPTAGVESLDDLLSNFFRRFRGTFFSVLRIQEWGSRQKGFERFRDFSLDEIRQAIFEAVSAGRFDTSISKKGSTLYGLSRKSGRG